MGAERVVIVSSYLSNNLIRVLALHATVMASGSLTHRLGCSMKWCFQRLHVIAELLLGMELSLVTLEN